MLRNPFNSSTKGTPTVEAQPAQHLPTFSDMLEIFADELKSSIYKLTVTGVIKWERWDSRCSYGWNVHDFGGKRLNIGLRENGESVLSIASHDIGRHDELWSLLNTQMRIDNEQAKLSRYAEDVIAINALLGRETGETE